MFMRMMCVLVGCVLILAVPPSYLGAETLSLESQAQPQAVTQSDSQYLVKFKPAVEDSRREEVLSELQLQPIKKLELVGVVVCVYKGDLPSPSVLEKAKQYTEIEYLEPDYMVHTQ